MPGREEEDVLREEEDARAEGRMPGREDARVEEGCPAGRRRMPGLKEGCPAGRMLGGRPGAEMSVPGPESPGIGIPVPAAPAAAPLGARGES